MSAKMTDDSSQDGGRRVSVGGEESTSQQILNRLRAGSVADAASMMLMDFNPQRSMWGATGNAIAHAPNITDLRSPVVGGENITFDSHGHSAREAPSEELKQRFILKRAQTSDSLFLSRSNTAKTQPGQSVNNNKNNAPLSTAKLEEGSSSNNQELDAEIDALAEPKVPWGKAVLHGLHAFWKFFITPTGFFMTIYGLNVVAWGAMLFFLLLHAAPAMDHPDNGGAIGSPRRVWIEIDSQILNALFCLTAWGLAPWRFRDLFWLGQWRLARDRSTSRRAIHRLAARNASWFRLREIDMDESDNVGAELVRKSTFSGIMAPPTTSWKMDFVVWMFVLNTLFQVGMAFFMWHWGYVERPSWGVGVFIGLGCAVSLAAGVMCWWEGRKIKLIEGPKVLNEKNVNNG